MRFSTFSWPGDDLLSRVLRQSTIGADVLNGRVRDGIGFYRVARATRPAKGWKQAPVLGFWSLWITVVRKRTLVMRVFKSIEELVPVS